VSEADATSPTSSPVSVLVLLVVLRWLDLPSLSRLLPRFVSAVAVVPSSPGWPRVRGTPVILENTRVASVESAATMRPSDFVGVV
jgi:hypothetical protein